MCVLCVLVYFALSAAMLCAMLRAMLLHILIQKRVCIPSCARYDLDGNCQLDLREFLHLIGDQANGGKLLVEASERDSTLALFQGGGNTARGGGGGEGGKNGSGAGGGVKGVEGNGIAYASNPMHNRSGKGVLTQMGDPVPPSDGGCCVVM